MSNERLTHKRSSGIKTGYWTEHKKDELAQRLGQYEDTGLSPEEIMVIKGQNIAIPLAVNEFEDYLEEVKEKVSAMKEEGLGYVSVLCQLATDVSNENPKWTFTAEQLKRIFNLAK